MPINFITIKDVASYDSTGVTLNNLKKLNFFFGYNGTGKSTIAKYLRNISLDPANQSPDFHNCTYTGYDSTKETILVYDEVFRKENFVDSDKMKGVFSLNHQNAVIDAKIQLLETEISTLEAGKSKITNTQQIAEQKLNSLKSDIVEKCFGCRDQFRSYVKQPLQYAKNKNQHFDHLKEVINQNQEAITPDEIRQEYEQLYENELKNITGNISQILVDNFHRAESNLSSLLQKIIIGKESVDIATLIKKLNISGWVNTGRSYLAQSGDICPFCQQPIQDKTLLEQQLGEFFDDSYNKDIDDINNGVTEYRQTCKAIKNVLMSLKDNEPIAVFCNDLLMSINEASANNETLIQTKLNNPNLNLQIRTVDILDELSKNINDEIQSNNTKVANLERLKSGWVQKCWNLMASDMKDQVANYDKKTRYINEHIITPIVLHTQIIENKIDYLRHQIEKLRGQTINTREAVDGINKILRNIGYNDFVIEEVPSSSSNPQYWLKRISNPSGNNVYRSLSEGEKTFISFLYFYHLCLGTNDIANSTKKKIIVIDDPISSLDSQTLFVVSSIIHKLDIHGADNHKFKDTNISQIIILTHNLYFYKEISLERRPMCKDLMHYRIQKPISGFSLIESQSKPYPTDDYSLLWKSVKECKSLTGVNESRNVMICNLMRRIIDSYVNFIGLFQGTGNPTWTAINSLPTTDPKYIVATSFISQINEESHGISPFDSVYYSNVIRQDTTVLFQAFKLVFDEIGPNHYNMMMA